MSPHGDAPCQDKTVEFDIRLFETYIRVDSNIEWSQDNSKPVVAYKRYCRSAIEYINLTKEIIKYADR